MVTLLLLTKKDTPSDAFTHTLKNKYYNSLTLLVSYTFLGQTLEPLVLVTYMYYYTYSSNLSTS